MTRSDDKRHEIELKLGPDAAGLLHDADALHKAFEGGDQLAPFECCSLWREADLAPSTLPDWVLDFLLKVAANYYSEGPHQVTPRALLDMSPKERKRLLPSLDKVAGLGGVQGKRDPWSWRAEYDRDVFMIPMLDDIKDWATYGGEPSPKATEIEKLARQNRWQMSDGSIVPILDNHDRLRSEVRDDVGRHFRVSGYAGEAWNKSWAVRRRVRSKKG